MSIKGIKINENQMIKFLIYRNSLKFTKINNLFFYLQNHIYKHLKIKDENISDIGSFNGIALCLHRCYPNIDIIRGDCSSYNEKFKKSPF